MSSADGKSGHVKNEPQGVHSSSKSNDVEQSQNRGDPNFSIVIKKEKNWPSDLGDDNDNDNDDEDPSDGDNFESLEEEDISNDPELTNKIKKKLIYEDGPFSENHIFWVNFQNEHVISARKEIRRLKKEVSKGTKDGAHNWELIEQLEEQLEEKERFFVKTYMKKIKFTENTPELHSVHLWWWTEPERNRMYKKKDDTCPDRSKLEVFINQLSRDIKFLKRYKNKYVSNMRTELELKKRQCFEEFYVLKTPEELKPSENHVRDIPVPFKPHIVIESPPWTDELSHDNKQRLIYTKQNSTNDHIFWTDARGEEVNKYRDVMKKTKAFLQRMIKAGIQTQIANAKEAIERQELYFISKYIHKVEIDHSLPLIHPMPQDLQKIIYDNNSNEESPFKIEICTEQEEMLVKLKDLKHKISLMGKYKNMYAPHVLNQLHHLEFEYKKKFLIAKNPDKIFPKYDMKLKQVNDDSKDASDNNKINLPSQGSGEKDDYHLENGPKNNPMASEDEDMNTGDEENEDNDDEEGMNSNHTSNNWSRWINELPSNVKKQLIYSKESNSDDHIFWVHTPDHSVTWAKKELAQMKKHFQKALQSGDANQINIMKKEIEDTEDVFVKNHFNKVEYDKTLPMIKPMRPKFRKGLYYVKNSDVTYNINHCPEQLKMLRALKAHRKVFSKMLRIKNMHAPLVVNELYHKEFEYQRQFLTMKKETEILSALKSRQESKKGLTKRHKKIMKRITQKQITEELQSAIKRRQEMPKILMKRTRQMAKTLDKGNASAGNKNTTNVQNSNIMNIFKQPGHTEFSQKNQGPFSLFAQTKEYNQTHFGNNKSHFVTNKTETRSELPRSDQEHNRYDSYGSIWGQDQREIQSRSDSLQLSKDGSVHMNIQIWEQPNRILGQQMKREESDNGEYEPERIQATNNEDYYSQYYGYNQSNFPSQPQWGQPNSNWNQTPTPGNNFRNQGGNFNQSWNNRGNQPQYNNSSYNQNTFERNDRFKQNSRHTKPHGYQPY
uniref:Uncharacterized protein n=1 Tax=Cacopsylla melanoneura TaxID=428564 RepID=A0A8D9EPU2_9HEMI